MGAWVALFPSPGGCARRGLRGGGSICHANAEIVSRRRADHRSASQGRARSVDADAEPARPHAEEKQAFTQENINKLQNRLAPLRAMYTELFHHTERFFVTYHESDLKLVLEVMEAFDRYTISMTMKCLGI